MTWRDLLKRKEALIAFDLGSSSAKILELDLTGAKPRLVSAAVTALAGDSIANNIVAKADKVSEQIASLMQANSIKLKRGVTAMPAPSVFTKKIRVSRMSAAELGPYIEMEAANFIPHNVNAVKMDYHVLGESGGQIEVFVVAVKSEIIESYVGCLNLIGVDLAVVDVDYFALQNSFELSYPEYIDQTVALVNLGSRYTSINICRKGESLFTGDVSMGGRMLTEALAEKLGISFEEAEKNKRTLDSAKSEHANLLSALEPGMEQIVTELNRQLSFFWSATGADTGIDRIMLSGGAALTPGLDKRLAEKTSISVEFLEPFRGLECGANFASGYLKGLEPLMAISVGMGLRQAGDRDLTRMS